MGKAHWIYGSDYGALYTSGAFIIQMSITIIIVSDKMYSLCMFFSQF
jgi:hypothetical protein